MLLQQRASNASKGCMSCKERAVFDPALQTSPGTPYASSISHSRSGHRYEKYLEEDKPKKKEQPKGDQFQTEFDEIDQAATHLSEVRSPVVFP